MEKIQINSISKIGDTIQYDYTVSDGIACFFSDRVFQINYPMNVEAVPDAVAVIPFVCNVLPIVWLADCELVLSEIDEAFYKCIPDVKKGYEAMFPESKFAGTITAKKIVLCDYPTAEKCAMFYSGGLDSVQTLISHLNEKPMLVAIWGSDIRYDNKDGWDVVHAAVTEASEKFGLLEVIIRSTFREFDNEGALDHHYSKQLKDGWWHGVKHAMGLIGHIAPYAYTYGISTMYIASTNCPLDGAVRCASNPATDNHICFCNCRVVHDGFEFSRQDKVRNFVDFCVSSKDIMTLHVCWESQTGGNCSCCEKCFRTMTGIIVQGDDPSKYGFKMDRIGQMQQIVCQPKYWANLRDYWVHIQGAMRKQKKAIKKSPYWNDIRWILNADFSHPETISSSLLYRIRNKLSRYKVYQWLHSIKEKL